MYLLFVQAELIFHRILIGFFPNSREKALSEQCIYRCYLTDPVFDIGGAQNMEVSNFSFFIFHSILMSIFAK